MEPRPIKCKGWGVPCGVELTAETEHIFGEAILCRDCDKRAWDDYFEALSELPVDSIVPEALGE